MKRVVVTGYAGFIGQQMARLLASRGHYVVGIDRRPAPAVPGIALTVTADLLSGDERVGAELAAADQVFHLAGRPGVRDSGPGLGQLRHRDNVVATQFVCEQVPAAAELVFASSSSVYGGASDGRANRETDSLRPLGGYAQSKVAAESVCHQRAAAGGRVLIARLFSVLGENQRADMALARWMDAVSQGRPLTILGSPDRSRDFTDVWQVVQALADLADRGVTGTVNIGTGHAYPLHEVIDAIGSVLRRTIQLECVPAGPEEVEHTRADTTRLQSALGWSLTTDLADVVARAARTRGEAAPDMSRRRDTHRTSADVPAQVNAERPQLTENTNG